ncbi:hypothetical protein [Streptomyces sp. NPDC017673]|uniref:hypothetical protein n=1 Tax=unclassified Streptomyces TaxID=2593676 RepID=UPI00379E79A1
MVIDAVLLADRPGPDQADIESGPLRSRLPAGAGRLAVAGALVAGAVLFPDGGLGLHRPLPAPGGTVLICVPADGLGQRLRVKD